jgi:hypothetical protein
MPRELLHDAPGFGGATTRRCREDFPQPVYVRSDAKAMELAIRPARITLERG